MTMRLKNSLCRNMGEKTVCTMEGRAKSMAATNIAVEAVLPTRRMAVMMSSAANLGSSVTFSRMIFSA